MASGEKLQDILESWQNKQNRRGKLLFELRTIDKVLGDFASAAKVLIGQGATTGDRARDITIGVHSTLESMVVLFYRQIEGEMASYVGQLVLVAEKVDNDDRRTCGLGGDNGGAVGLMPTRRPDPHRRLSIGRLSGKELIFDHKKMEVSFLTDGTMVSCITDWDCRIFINRGRPKLEPANLPLKVSTEDALTSSDGRPMPSGMSILIGDKMIEQWFKKNAPLGILRMVPETPSLWGKILARLNPAVV